MDRLEAAGVRIMDTAFTNTASVSPSENQLPRPAGGVEPGFMSPPLPERAAARVHRAVRAVPGPIEARDALYPARDKQNVEAVAGRGRPAAAARAKGSGPWRASGA
jgi:hypothetical protein